MGMEIKGINGPKLAGRWETSATNESNNRCDWAWQTEGEKKQLLKYWENERVVQGKHRGTLATWENLIVKQK